MTQAEEDLVKAIKALGRVQKKYDSLMKQHEGRVRILRVAVGDKCSHLIQEDFRWEHDDGYGRQSMHTGKHCVICDKKNRWPSISQYWSNEKG